MTVITVIITTTIKIAITIPVTVTVMAETITMVMTRIKVFTIVCPSHLPDFDEYKYEAGNVVTPQVTISPDYNSYGRY